MITIQMVQDLIREFIDELTTANPGYQSYSRTLRKQIPGKTQIRSAFIENLGEYMILSDDDKVEAYIKKVLKKYQ